MFGFEKQAKIALNIRIKNKQWRRKRDNSKSSSTTSAMYCMPNLISLSQGKHYAYYQAQHSEAEVRQPSDQSSQPVVLI